MKIRNSGQVVTGGAGIYIHKRIPGSCSQNPAQILNAQRCSNCWMVEANAICVWHFAGCLSATFLPLYNPSLRTVFERFLQYHPALFPRPAADLIW